MHCTYRKTLTYALLIPPVVAAAHLISACENSSDLFPSKNQPSSATPGNSQSSALLTGTTAVSPEALFDFLYGATRFEFWNCASSDDTENTYFVLDSKDDKMDEGFNPLMLLGLSREPQLLGDPRARNENDRKKDVELRTTPVSFAVTGSDSISITMYSDRNFTPDINDTTINLTEVRTGPGRAFSAAGKNKSKILTCEAHNVGANIMF